MTTLDEVADLFLSLVNDFRLTTLYQSSGSGALNTYLEPWLMQAIDEFEDCTQVLTYDTTTQAFSVTLTQKHKNILAQIMVQYWLLKEMNDVLQMNIIIQDPGFKTHSSSQNLKEKRELYNAKREEISQLLLSYAYKNSVSWEDWKDQDFD